MEKNKPNISSRAFWDVDFETIDFEASQNWVILKVCLSEKETDFDEIIKFYGKDTVESVISDRIAEIFNIKIANHFVMHEVAMLNFRRKLIEKGEVILKCNQCGNIDEKKMTICKTIKPKIVIYEIECHICKYKSNINLFT